MAVYDEYLRGRRQTLRPQYENAQEPWSYSQFTENALRSAIHRIRTGAGSNTRPLYAKGETNSDNWVARWFLYHICRYRDSRNLRASRSNKFHEDDDKNLGDEGV